VRELTVEEQIEAAHLLGVVKRSYFPKARPKQRTPPGVWRTWLTLAGRGYGKTLQGAEDLVEYMDANQGVRCGLAAQTIALARDVDVEGDAGVLSVLDRREIRHNWNRSLGELTLPDSDSRLKTCSGEEPDSFRGPGYHRFWCDELAAWERMEDCWKIMGPSVRLGAHPQIVVTTTPQPWKFLKKLRGRPSTVTTTGSMRENAANLPDDFMEEMEDLYGGTRWGQQELEGLLLDEETGLIFDESALSQHWQWVDAAEGQLVDLAGRHIRLADCHRFATVDLAAGLRTSRDYTVMAAWAVTERADLVLLDRKRAQITERQHYRSLAPLVQRWELEWVGLEKSQHSTELVRQMTKEMPEIHIRSLVPDADKVTRALPASGIASDGRLWLPEERWAYPGPDDSMVDECVEFPPEQGKGGHDDQVDVLAYAAREVSRVTQRLRNKSETSELHPTAQRRLAFRKQRERKMRMARRHGFG